MTRPLSPLARMMMDAARTGGYFDSDTLRSEGKWPTARPSSSSSPGAKSVVLDTSTKSTLLPGKGTAETPGSVTPTPEEVSRVKAWYEESTKLDPEAFKKLMMTTPYDPSRESTSMTMSGKTVSGAWLDDIDKKTGIPFMEEPTTMATPIKKDPIEQAKVAALRLIRDKHGPGAVDAPSSMEVDKRLANALARNGYVDNPARGKDWADCWDTEYTEALKVALDTGMTMEAAAVSEALAIPNFDPANDDVAATLSALTPKQEHSPEVELERALDQAELEQDPDYAKW